MCLLPRSPKMLISLAISCPMARPEPDGARTRGDFGAQVEPRCLEPRPLGKALTSFAYESPKPRESVP